MCPMFRPHLPQQHCTFVIVLHGHLLPVGICHEKIIKYIGSSNMKVENDLEIFQFQF